MTPKLGYNPKIGWVLLPLDLKDPAVLKQYGGRKAPNNNWIFPGVACYAERLIADFQTLDVLPSAKERLEGWGFPAKDLKNNLHPSWGTMFDYQKEAITYLASSPLHGSLLNITQGLGKCAISIIAADLSGYSRVLVVSPLSVLHTWYNECKKWGFYDTPTILHGNKDPVPESGWVITNYDTVVRHPAEYLKDWDLLILDESVLVKSRGTKRASVLKKICHKACKVWELSGSPMTKHVDDLWAQFQLLDYQKFPSYWRFADFYCYTDETPWGKIVTGSREMDFQKEFRDIMFVKNQKNVLDLPPVLYETMDLEMGKVQSDLYYQVQYGVVQDLLNHKLNPQNRMAQLVRLQQIVSSTSNVVETLGLGTSCKVDCVKEMLEAGVWETPILIWVHWRETGFEIVDAIESLQKYRVAHVYGSTPERQRDILLNAYKEGKKDILVLSLGVGKFGLTLTNTKTVVYVDRTYPMDDYVQSLYRVQRIGLDHSPLVVTLRIPGTVEELVEDNLAGKAQDIARVSDADLATLLAGLGRRQNHS